MRYDEFRDQWLAALRGARVLADHDRPEETADLTTMARRWEVHVIAPSAEPFHPAATIGFDWDAHESARSYTCEEDLLTDLYGRRASRATQPRVIRVDFVFRAALTWGSTIPLPRPEVWNPWIVTVEEKLDDALAATRRRKAPANVWRGELELEGRPRPEGPFALHGLSTSSGELVVVPRVWSDARRHRIARPRLASASMSSQPASERVSMPGWGVSTSWRAGCVTLRTRRRPARDGEAGPQTAMTAALRPDTEGTRTAAEALL